MIAVASGKGGVGKSSLTVNLALALRARGLEVGIVDADIYGYSIPGMLGIQQRPVVVDKMIVPPVAHDLKVMSIGFFLDDGGSVVWRGPMLHRALEQFLSDVYWGPLDYLLIDMPPGTGDVGLSLGQLLPRSEAVLVTTPQLAAQRVAERAAQMVEKLGQPLLGVIENMSSLACPCCGEATYPFGQGGGAALAGAARRPAARRGAARARAARGQRQRRPGVRLASRRPGVARDRRDRAAHRGHRPRPRRARAHLLAARRPQGLSRPGTRVAPPDGGLQCPLASADRSRVRNRGPGGGVVGRASADRRARYCACALGRDSQCHGRDRPACVPCAVLPARGRSPARRGRPRRR